MNVTTRMILILILLLPAFGALAQETTTAPTETTGTATETTATETTDTATTISAPGPEGEGTSYEVRNQFTRLLQRHPDELSTILVLEPTLLRNDTFLAGHPEIARFVAAHPEVRENASFYLGDFRAPSQRNSVLEQILEPISIVSVFAIIAFALSWLVRTFIEQKRWSRLSRTQSEVHNKILDRFGTTSELLEYVKTPAGSKFLESAPIPLHSEPARQVSPYSRVIWSIQIGVVVAAAAIGMLLVSLRFDGDSGQELFALGVIALCIGLGFVASAAVSIILSRRLGAWDANPSAGDSVQ